MTKHILIIAVVIFSIVMASIQKQPELDYTYIYTTEDGWRCTLTIHTDECDPIDSKVGGQR